MNTIKPAKVFYLRKAELSEIESKKTSTLSGKMLRIFREKEIVTPVF